MLVTGHEGERDRRIELVEAPRFGIVGKNQTIVARVLDSDDHGEPAEVAVRARRPDDRHAATRASASGSKSPRRSITPATISSNWRSRELPNELTAINNKAVVTIDGVRDKLRVLLVSGEPHPGERMWRNHV